MVEKGEERDEPGLSGRGEVAGEEGRVVVVVTRSTELRHVRAGTRILEKPIVFGTGSLSPTLLQHKPGN